MTCTQPPFTLQLQKSAVDSYCNVFRLRIDKKDNVVVLPKKKLPSGMPVTAVIWALCKSLGFAY